MSSEEVAKLPKPKMRGLLHAQISRNLILTGVTCTIAGIAMKIWGSNRKAAYAEFYENYDIEKEFKRMRNKGLFKSCESGDDDDKKKKK